MAKISPVSIKYMIHANFEAEGTLEKPDVIGALFGQTEGLLGSDLEMRELQKEGKIGRIEVELEKKDSKTVGKIELPSALDKTETTLIAAAIETIERIGPSTAKITIEKIEDVRENKRDYILERAKRLLESIEEKMPKTREMTQNIKDESRAEKIKEYGAEKLPCGNIEGNELIVVEGRADVVNLLRNNVDNVIGMNGTKLPEGVKALSQEKEVTLFVDGDRGGVLIARNVIDNARVDFVATAPEGKEVEELAGKEILISLRRKVPVSEFLKRLNRDFRESRDNSYRNNRYSRDDRFSGDSFRERRRYPEERVYRDSDEKPAAVEKVSEKKQLEINLDDKKPELKKFLQEVEGTTSAIVLSDNLEVEANTTARNLSSALRKSRNAFIIVVDTVTPSVIRAAESGNIRNIVAKNFSFNQPTDLNLISL